MAKNREVNYFAKINSDEDLEKFLVQHNALISKEIDFTWMNQRLFVSFNWSVLDVYQDLFGPCTSLHGTLESAKVSQRDKAKPFIIILIHFSLS